MMDMNKNFRLNFKISALLGAVIFLIIIIYLLIFTNHYQKYEYEIIGQENINTLRSIDSSLSTMAASADNYSKMILADSVVQQMMETGDILDDFSKQQTLMKRIYSVLQFSEFIDMIWLTDQQGQRLIIGDSASIHTDSGSGYEGKYEWLRKPYGEPELVVEKGENTNSLMLIRSFNSLERFASLGLIGVQINQDKIDHLISNSIDYENEQIAILNFDNEIIYRGGTQGAVGDVVKAAEAISLSDRELIKKEHINGKDYYLLGVVNPKNGWKIFRYTPIVRNKDINTLVRFNILLILIIGLLIFCGASAIAHMLTIPIQQLLCYMKNVEGGQLEKIQEQTLLQEFKSLFHGYNRLVDEIKRLIQETIERQKRIRIVEMNEIQEQMKPHFLYNALDSVEALAMLGDTDNACRLIEALGGFYKKCVSGGREYISIDSEIRMVHDYMEILKIRFGDLFQFDIEVEDSCRKYEIPKLTIQPLVENSFQHGIRPNKTSGYIRVCVKEESGKLHILVQDNGKGIPDDIVSELQNLKDCGEKKSLGLRGTIQRLKLIYENAFSFEIRNQGLSEIHLYLDTDVLGE